VTNPSAPPGNLQASRACEERWVTLDGARMRYLYSGSGPALVLVHGLLGYSFSWRFNIPVLSQHATVYAVDMLGTGFSERPAGLDCSLHASAERLLRFMDEAGIASCDLLGTSRGGAVAMMAAALAPQRIQRLILPDPVNPWSLHGRRLAAFLSNRAVSALFLWLAPLMPSAHRLVLRRLYGDARRISPGTLEGYSAPLAIPGSLEHALGILRTWSQDLQQLESMLPRIAHIPTLLIWGSLDRAVSPTSATALREQFRNCRLVTMGGVGHLPYEEVPEEFNTVVSKFLDTPIKSA
jgi:pimeloyl-ACP methyl ester carboxylesterase